MIAVIVEIPDELHSRLLLGYMCENVCLVHFDEDGDEQMECCWSSAWSLMYLRLCAH